MPQQEQDRQRSYALSRKALELIDELGLSANPINYAVFFASVEKSNEDLVALIDILQSNKRLAMPCCLVIICATISKPTRS